MSLDPKTELVINAKTGAVRQAGADMAGNQIAEWKQLAERDLYFFSKFVGNYNIPRPVPFSVALHGWLCRKIQDRTHARKMVLIPREHAKSRIGSHCLPPHILLQPKEHNVYFPGMNGADTRILLCGESGMVITSHMRACLAFFETNDLFKAWWPHLIWPNANRDAKVWNAQQFIVPRPTSFGDPSVRALGADSAVTGSRTDVQIVDDIISLKASNSSTVMNTAIEFYKALKPLQEDYLKSLQYIFGTRWAPSDVYEYIETNEPEVKVYIRKAIEDGKPLWPEKYSLAVLDALKQDLKELFWLNYMNESTHGSLVDFNPEMVRFWRLQDGLYTFEEDPRDSALAQQAGKKMEKEPLPKQLQQLKTRDLTEMLGRDEYLRFKHA